MFRELAAFHKAIALCALYYKLTTRRFERSEGKREAERASQPLVIKAKSQ